VRSGGTWWAWTQPWFDSVGSGTVCEVVFNEELPRADPDHHDMRPCISLVLYPEAGAMRALWGLLSLSGLVAAGALASGAGQYDNSAKCW
jgi:hypothetical protein